MTDRQRWNRNWLGVSLLAVVMSLATAVTILLELGDGLIAVTAVLVALAATAVAAVVPEALSEAWAEHRRYVGFATGLFGLGAIGGGVLFLAGIDLTDLFLELVADELGAEDGDADDLEIEFSATFYVMQNTPPFLLAIAGAFTLGLFTAFVMVFNGILVGNIVFAVASVAGIDFILVGLAPHGIFELPALFIASGVGFRLVHRFGQRVRGSRDAFLTRAYLRRTAIFVLFAWLLLVVAAFVEAYLTPAVLEALFASRFE